ncbi:serine/threonine protein kinase, partial [Trichormus variabilis ARAD]|nr:serine/threonine protein kinase [Trichormus variabilis ARAD]
MILWVTLLYDVQLSLIRWLSYFIDLQENRGQKIVKALAETGYYHLLFFAIEEPTNCAQVVTLILTAQQRQQLTDWLTFKQNIKSNELVPAEQARKILKTEYEKIKLEILESLAVNKPQEQMEIKSWLTKLIDKVLQIFKYQS